MELQKTQIAKSILKKMNKYKIIGSDSKQMTEV